jgi:hypothetical protein
MGNAVKLKYGGSEFNITTSSINPDKTQTPLINIDTSANRDVNNKVLSYTSTIQIEGTIVEPNISSGIANYSGIFNFFSDGSKQGSPFEIKCSGNNSSFLIYSGTYFKTAVASKSNDNWGMTIPYSITLESNYPASGMSGLIESYEDNWNIEPLEDPSYIELNLNSPQFMGQVSSSVPDPTSLSTSSPSIFYKNFLQYKISRRVSAVGKNYTWTSGNIQNATPSPNQTYGSGNQACFEAAKWVRSRIEDNTVIPLDSNINFYNHMRTVEINPAAGSYGITDTWLALGTGISYTEDFTWEISTDDKMMKTVTINGTVKGLEKASGTIPITVFPSSYLPVSGIGSGLLTNFNNQNLLNNKLASAISGYRTVKGLLYSRASLALSAMSGLPNSAPEGSVPSITWVTQTPSPLLNLNPVSFSETINANAGSVSYSVTYNNKLPLLSGAISVSLTISDTNSTDQIAETFVLGRLLGPILERVGYTRPERRLSLEAVYPLPTGFSQLHPNSPTFIINKNNVDALVYSFRPIAPDSFASIGPTSSYGVANQGQVFKVGDSTNWSPFEGRYTRDVSWVYNTGVCS